MDKTQERTEQVCVMHTPVGALTLSASDKGITSISFGSGRARETNDRARGGHLEDAVKQLAEYFAGWRKTFDLPLDLRGTPFQKAVWDALLQIPYGERRTYGEIAALVGSPKAARAVGMACNRNPVVIVVPCHRVVGSNGQLVGYGGGIDLKEHLLRFETSHAGDGL